MRREYILLNGFRKAKNVYTARFHFPIRSYFATNIDLPYPRYIGGKATSYVKVRGCFPLDM